MRDSIFQSIFIFVYICAIPYLLAQEPKLKDQQETSPSLTSQNVDSTIQNNDNARKITKGDEERAKEAVGLIKDWSFGFGRDIHYGNQEATCYRSIRDQFDPAITDRSRRGNYKTSIVSTDWTRYHDEITQTIGTTMSWHKTAVENIARAAENLAGNHTFNKTLRANYIDVHRLQDVEEEEMPVDGNGKQELIVDHGNDQPTDGQISGNIDATQSGDNSMQDSNGSYTENLDESLPIPQKLVTEADHESGDDNGESDEWQTPKVTLKLSKQKNFGDVAINTDESAVHVPVHIFPGDPQVMNGIAWSEHLTKVFHDNYARNPKLTNQYFASPYGFLRLYPAQKWQIPKIDPDLYDARKRPWYVAGASSRKDMIILVDSSGSMTGSRRDIARGVVFELLDTLTDNDNFMVLKFSDSIEQVGVPSCPEMQMNLSSPSIPLQNTFHLHPRKLEINETDLESLYLIPANGRNIRQVKTNFTIPTSGIANFSRALVTAFEVLKNYQDTGTMGAQCNQAIMLITDGSPSDFEDIFRSYNYPNAPVRVFTYLIGREAGDVSHTKMMACSNRGYYTHVINLAEVRETVQQYIPVMARPLVLNGTHPTTWTSAYGELTYEILTDWIWESKRRKRAEEILADTRRAPGQESGIDSSVPEIRYTSEDGGDMYPPLSYDDGYDTSSIDNRELEEIDLFGYYSNPDCFWETHRNDLLTTVVRPVYDRNNESIITEKFLMKNIWTTKESVMRTAQILGVAAADMQINDIISLAPTYKLGPNGYAIMLSNSGFVMHHPDLRSILEPIRGSEVNLKNMRILKPYFSSTDFIRIEHVLNNSSDEEFIALRQEAVAGLTGWRELQTKRTVDCQRRVQTRTQSFYYKGIRDYPFSFMLSIPQPYGSHKIHAEVEIRNPGLPEKIASYFINTDYDLWTVHPDYQYCQGPSNVSITTLLDVFHRVEDMQWRAVSMSDPPLFIPNKIYCDKDLVQSLVYDAVATFGFSENCGPANPNAESNLIRMFGARFAFVATRSGLTRLRSFNIEDETIKKEALAFSKLHAKTIDETFYSRTVDYNMLISENATLVQVPFNLHEKIHQRFNKYDLDLLFNYASPQSSGHEPEDLLVTENSSSADPTDSSLSITRLLIKDMNLTQRLEVIANSSLHVIATQSIVVNEGTQRAVAGVVGVFYSYSAFVLRLLKFTETRFKATGPITRPSSCFAGSTDESCRDMTDLRCGHLNDTIDCLLVDNNGYIVFSEDLSFVGRHLRAYEANILNRLVDLGVYHEVKITDHQAVCLSQEQEPKQQASSSASHLLFGPMKFVLSLVGSLLGNSLAVISFIWFQIITQMDELVMAQSRDSMAKLAIMQQQQQLGIQNAPLSYNLPNKTYLRPCEKILTLYETRANLPVSSEAQFYKTTCKCDAWFVYEPVQNTNLIMMMVDSSAGCRQGCAEATQSSGDSLDTPIEVIEEIEEKKKEANVCSALDRESKLYKRRVDSCFSHHPDEEHIKICGGSPKSIALSYSLVLLILSSSVLVAIFQSHHSNLYFTVDTSTPN